VEANLIILAPGQIDLVQLYLCGVFGSAAAEIVAALRETQKLSGRCPELYKRPFYICVRILVALVPAGGLPVLLSASNLQTAFYLGLSAPLLLDRLQRSLQSDGQQEPPASHPKG
jgi:hypothetical protein